MISNMWGVPFNFPLNLPEQGTLKKQLAMGQHPVPPVNIAIRKSRLKWVVHLPQNGTIAFDPQPSANSAPAFSRSKAQAGVEVQQWRQLVRRDPQHAEAQLHDVRAQHRVEASTKTSRVWQKSAMIICKWMGVVRLQKNKKTNLIKPCKLPHTKLHPPGWC